MRDYLKKIKRLSKIANVDPRLCTHLYMHKNTLIHTNTYINMSHTYKQETKRSQHNAINFIIQLANSLQRIYSKIKDKKEQQNLSQTRGNKKGNGVVQCENLNFIQEQKLHTHNALGEQLTPTGATVNSMLPVCTTWLSNYRSKQSYVDSE